MENELRRRRGEECFRTRELGGEGKSNWRGLGKRDGDHRRVRDDGLGESGSSIFERLGYNRTPVNGQFEESEWEKREGMFFEGKSSRCSKLLG